MKTKTILLFSAIIIAGLIFSQRLIPIAMAAPTVNSVGGTINNGQAITISGSGFGTKSPAAPIDFWTFDEGTDGSVVSRSGWTATSDSPTSRPQYNSSRYYGSSGKSMLTNPQHLYRMKSGIYWDENPPPSPQTLYITYNSWKEGPGGSTTGSWGNCCFIKYVRLSSTNNMPELIISDNGDGGPWLRIGAYRIDGQSDILDVNFQFDKWTRDELFLNAGTQGNSDASFKYWNHDIGTAITSYSHNIAFPLLTDSQRVYSYRLGNELFDRHWVDNVYIDHTQARVEIGDKSTWNACAHREIQVPSAWSSSSITFIARQGTFSGSGTAYLYVVDSTGAMNSNGYPITIGSGGGTPPPSDTTPPAAPRGLKIN